MQKLCSEERFYAKSLYEMLRTTLKIKTYSVHSDSKRKPWHITNINIYVFCLEGASM